MLTFLPGPVLGVLMMFGLTFMCILTTLLLVIVGLGKAICLGRGYPFFERINRVLVGLWVLSNKLFFKLFITTTIEIDNLPDLKRDCWYLVLCNHQSWLDIIMIQDLLFPRIPLLKFFVKKELLHVPFLGVAIWVLGCPFMRRYSKEYLAKHPECQGRDVETARKACQRFKQTPTSVINFTEGTRLTAKKYQVQQPPYQYLLNPKLGGIGMVMGAMGEQMTEIIDVTLVYQSKVPLSLWNFCCNRLDNIKIHVTTRPIPDNFRGNKFHDQGDREAFQTWISQIWKEKDGTIGRLLEEYSHPAQSQEQSH